MKNVCKIQIIILHNGICNFAYFPGKWPNYDGQHGELKVNCLQYFIVGPMSNLLTKWFICRDPVFHRWHKYVDMVFDKYKISLPPYQYENRGEFPLAWKTIKVTDIVVQTSEFRSKPNELRTYFMKSHADMARGLDFTRTDVNRLGPIWLRFTHLNHDPFEYTITVMNESRTDARATVRIYMAPRLNEHGEQFVMMQQRKLFIEMDKFVETCK